MGRSRRWVTSGLIALAVGLTVNVAAARLDAHSDDARRSSAEHDLRARLAARGVRDARVECQTGMTCTVTLPDGRTAQVDPRDP
jgi:preprotein translocase subunit SecD